MYDLTKKPLDCLHIAGKDYDINLSFDKVIKFYRACEPDAMNINRLLTAFFELCPDAKGQITKEDAADSLFLLSEYISYAPYGYSGNTDITGETIESNEEDTKFYDYEQDAMAIYASFKIYAGIDLYDEIGRLHWIKFKAIFDALPDDSQIKRIIKVRQYEPTAEERKDGQFMASLAQQRQFYRLKTSQQERENTIAQFIKEE